MTSKIIHSYQAEKVKEILKKAYEHFYSTIEKAISFDKATGSRHTDLYERIANDADERLPEQYGFSDGWLSGFLNIETKEPKSKVQLISLNELIKYYFSHILTKDNKIRKSGKNILSNSDKRTLHHILVTDEFEISIPGTKTIGQEFRNDIISGKEFTPSQFYTAKQDDACQWFGVHKAFDIKRKEYKSIKQTLQLSFDKYRKAKVAAIIHGVGGCGKSTLLRRLAFDLFQQHFQVLWVEELAFDLFKTKGLEEIAKHPDRNFLVFIEDWYRLTNNKLTVGRDFLRSTRPMNNVRIVIGDRDIKGKPYLEECYKQKSMYPLGHSENEKIIDEIIDNIKEWKPIADKLFQNEGAYESPLFMILFVLARVYESTWIHDDFDLSEPSTAFQNIIKHDLDFVFQKSNGLAQALFLWSCLYKQFRLPISYEFLLLLADYFAGDTSTSTFFKNPLGESEVHSRLRHYIHVNRSTEMGKRYREHNFVRFNHDILADEGMAYINQLLPELGSYDDSAKLKLLEGLVRFSNVDYSCSITLATLIENENSLFVNSAEKVNYVKRLIANGNQETQYLNSLVKLEISLEDREHLMKVLEENKLYPFWLWTIHLKKNPSATLSIMRKDDFLALPHELISLAIKNCPDSVLKEQKILDLFSLDKFYLLPLIGAVPTALKLVKNPNARDKAIEQILEYKKLENIYYGTITAALDLCEDNLDWLKQKTIKKILHSVDILDYPVHIINRALANADKDDIHVAESRILQTDDFRNIPDALFSKTLKKSEIEENNILKQKIISDILSAPELVTLQEQIINSALLYSENEVEKQKALKRILEFDEFYELSPGILPRALKEPGNSPAKKTAIRRVLKYRKIYDLPFGVVSTVLKLAPKDELRDDAVGRIMTHPKPLTINPKILNTAMKSDPRKTDLEDIIETVYAVADLNDVPFGVLPTVLSIDKKNKRCQKKITEIMNYPNFLQLKDFGAVCTTLRLTDDTDKRNKYIELALSKEFINDLPKQIVDTAIALSRES